MTNKHECPYCARRNPCAESGPRGFVCTRPPGHKLPHVACSLTTHELEVWPKNPVEQTIARLLESTFSEISWEFDDLTHTEQLIVENPEQLAKIREWVKEHLDNDT